MTRQTAKTSESFHRGAHPEPEVANARALGETLSSASAAKSRPLLLGHRGARPTSRNGGDKIPSENSLACFEYALANGCDGFEFDVRATRDGRLVLCHNAWLRGYNISASVFASLCSRCGKTLPCLEDVLRVFDGRAYLDIEVKAVGAEELIVEAVRRSGHRNLLLSSFLPEVLHRLHKLDRSLPLGYVCQRATGVRVWRELPIQVFLPHYELISEKLVRDAHERDTQIFTWTVNREEDLRQLASWGVDGLISDDPKLLSRTFPASMSGEKRIAKGE